MQQEYTSVQKSEIDWEKTYPVYKLKLMETHQLSKEKNGIKETLKCNKNKRQHK